MSFAKKLDRAVQWAGEKMGSEAKTAHSDEFQRLEAEMALRQEGLLSWYLLVLVWCESNTSP